MDGVLDIGSVGKTRRDFSVRGRHYYCMMEEEEDLKEGRPWYRQC